MIAGTDTCAACRELSALAAAEGREGFVRCSACLSIVSQVDASPEVSTEDLEDALRAASSALPGGSLLIMVIVVNEVGGEALVHQASNVRDEATRQRVLKTALGAMRMPS